jgi:hypothetical protein
MLTEKEQRLMKKFEKQLRLPKWKYILLYGMLLWGGLVLLIMTMTDRFLFNKSFDQQWHGELPGRLIALPIAGIFLGWFMWSYSRKQLQKLKKKKKFLNRGTLLLPPPLAPYILPASHTTCTGSSRSIYKRIGG